MDAAGSVEEFIRDPIGRWVAGRTWLSFCTPTGVPGFVWWGRPTEDDVKSFIRAIPIEDSPLAERRSRFIDIRKLEVPEPAAFTAFVDYFAQYADRLHDIVIRAAVVHPSGMSGALAIGFQEAAGTRYPFELFTDARAALEWLKEDVALLDELDVIQATAVGVTPLLRNLRARIATEPQGATLPRVAASLGISARSLQRRLLEQNTSFQKELDGVRVELARRILRGGASVAEAAGAVGCASPHHFGVLFRKMTGLAPSEWAKSVRDDR